MIPILYKANEINFNHNGLGFLKDCTSCKVIEESNGIYELELTDPVGSFLFEEIKGQRILKAKANDRHDPQLFRIYNISKPINGIITVKAEHISYKLKDNFIESLSYTGNCAGILNAINNNATFKTGFNFGSNLSGNYAVMLERRNLLSAILGQEGSLLQSLGNNACVIRDNFNFYINSVNQDNNVLIAYRKNMTGFKCEGEWSKCITKIYPYATKTIEQEGQESREVTITLKEKYIDSQYINDYANPIIQDVDFTDKFNEDEEITEDTLRKKASQYFIETKCDIPKFTYNIELVALSKTEEYKDFILQEDIGLYDTLIVRHDIYNLDTKVKVIKTEYDSLSEMYTKIELGQPKITLSDTFGKINNSINNINNTINNTKNELNNTINNVKTDNTDKLNGAVNNFNNLLNNAIKDTKEDLNNNINNVKNDSSSALEKAKEELNNAISTSNNNNNSALEKAKENLNNAILQYTGDKATTESLNEARTELNNAINKVNNDNKKAIDNTKIELNNTINNAKNELSNTIDNVKNDSFNNIEKAKEDLLKTINDFDGSKASIEDLKKAKEDLNTAIENSNLDKATKDELKKAKEELEKTINDALKDIVTKNTMDKAIKEVSEAITGYDGGYVRLNPPTNPSEILVMDNEDINSARTVWRWNKEGLGVSTNGYNGLYTGLTKNGKLVINETTTNSLTTNFIKTQVIDSINTNSKYFHLDTETGAKFGDIEKGCYTAIGANGLEHVYKSGAVPYLYVVKAIDFNITKNDGQSYLEEVMFTQDLTDLLNGRVPNTVLLLNVKANVNNTIRDESICFVYAKRSDRVILRIKIQAWDNGQHYGGTIRGTILVLS